MKMLDTILALDAFLKVKYFILDNNPNMTYAFLIAKYTLTTLSVYCVF